MENILNSQYQNTIQYTTTIKTNVFPCKSINLVRFLKQNGLLSEHKYTDNQDKKDCWIFLRTDKLNDLLAQWKVIQDKRFSNNTTQIYK